MQKQAKFPQKILDSKPHDWRWVDYDYASFRAQQAGIKSFRQYRRWVKEWQPGGMPSRPDYCYEEFTTWSKFLNNKNYYLANHPDAVTKTELMSFWDAVNIIQKMEFINREEYHEAWDEGKIPKGIPRAPDVRYEDFTRYGGWYNFLGKQIKHKVQAAEKIQGVLMLYTIKDQSPNIINVMVHKQAFLILQQYLKSNPNIQPVKAYNWYDDFAEEVFNILDKHGTKQSDTSWLFNNVNDLFYELGSVLESYQPR